MVKLEYQEGVNFLREIKDELAIVKVTATQLMQKPDVKSELADETLFGEIVRILEHCTDGWLYIETHYNYRGYVREESLFADTGKAQQWSEKAICYIDSSFADVTSESRYESSIIMVLVRGSRIVLTDREEDRWVEILLPDGNTGWVRKCFVKMFENSVQTANEEELRKRLVDTALSYLGTQYRWGGKTPLGIDCSGLCSVSYLINGIIIYRDAELKEEYMRSINRDEMKPGDLIFFPGHVAMYIGDDRYVHSNGKDGFVAISSLNPEHQDYRWELANGISCIGTIF